MHAYNSSASNSYMLAGTGGVFGGGGGAGQYGQGGIAGLAGGGGASGYANYGNVQSWENTYACNGLGGRGIVVIQYAITI